MKVVTVGTGMAPAEFVERLRLEGFTGDVVMCGDEDFPPYSPCVIPFYLAGEPLDTVFWKGRDFYGKYGVTARTGDPVAQVDVERRLVRTAAGRVNPMTGCFTQPVPGAGIPTLSGLTPRASSASRHSPTWWKLTDTFPSWEYRRR